MNANRLAAMFESENTSDREYYGRFRPYDGDSALGAKPWWPPLSEVWALQGECPDEWPNKAAWAEAWALLRRLHAEYQAARKRND